MSLEKDLNDYAPKPWKINLPFRDYWLRWEDLIPALSGAIGKVSLVAAFAMAWATGFGITDPTFVTENVRLEVVVAGVFTLIFSAVLHPAAGPPGTLAPLIPLVPLMVAAGVHPLPFAILISLAGFVFARNGYFQHIVNLNGIGTKAGILLLFGIMGITSSLQKLQAWTADSHQTSMFFVLIISGAMLYFLLVRLKAKWLIIPASALVSLIISSLYGLFPVFDTGIGLPIIDPVHWWNHKWGIGFGMTTQNFVTAIPFALLVMTMWPMDALAVKTLQETNYPPTAKRAVMDLNATFIVVTVRNLIGALLGGAQTAAVWRSFMIPLAVVKRPIGGSALLLGIFAIAFAILGFPIDLSVFPPLVWLVLILGVFAPMLEIGLRTIRNASSVRIALICIILGIAINPVIGWSVALLIENLNLIRSNNTKQALPTKSKLWTVLIFLASAITYLVTL
ncbi:MAG: DUF3360 family protein [Saccharofermentanales bacterium]